VLLESLLLLLDSSVNNVLGEFIVDEAKDGTTGSTVDDDESVVLSSRSRIPVDVAIYCEIAEKRSLYLHASNPCPLKSRGVAYTPGEP
jgi:hypothetical protein